MPWYLLRSHGPDENTTLWIEHDDEMSEYEFDELVMSVARRVVAADPHRSWNEKKGWERPMPWWGSVIDEVRKILCEEFGFRPIEAAAKFSRSWSSSWESFLPDAAEFIAEQRGLAEEE